MVDKEHGSLNAPAALKALNHLSGIWLCELTLPFLRRSTGILSGKTQDNAKHHWELIVSYNLVCLVPLEARSHTPVVVLSLWGKELLCLKGPTKGRNSITQLMPVSAPHILNAQHQ